MLVYANDLTIWREGWSNSVASYRFAILPGIAARVRTLARYLQVSPEREFRLSDDEDAGITVIKVGSERLRVVGPWLLEASSAGFAISLAPSEDGKKLPPAIGQTLLWFRRLCMINGKPWVPERLRVCLRDAMGIKGDERPWPGKELGARTISRVEGVSETVEIPGRFLPEVLGLVGMRNDDTPFIYNGRRVFAEISYAFPEVGFVDPQNE